MFLPILPTTPILLLASAMFFRSSEKWSKWLLNHKTFGPPIRNYMEHKAVSKKSRIFALVFLWPTILISASMVDKIWLKILLIAIALGVTIHLMSLKTMPEDGEQ